MKNVLLVAVVGVKRGTSHSCTIEDLLDSDVAKVTLTHKLDQSLPERGRSARDARIWFGLPNSIVLVVRHLRQQSGKRVILPAGQQSTTRTMTTNRSAAYAMIAGSAAGLVTMTLHPTGHDVVRNASEGASNMLNTSVHLLAIVAQPMVLAGTLGLTVRLTTRRDLAFGAFIFFALASFAVVLAALASGFIAPAVLEGMNNATESRREGMLGALGYTGILNQAFAKLYVVFAGAAILLWSVAIVKGREMSRWLGAYGIALGLGLVAVIALGIVRLDIHGFGAVAILVGAWMVWAAINLLRSPQE